MERRMGAIMGATMIVCTAPDMEPPRVFLERNPNHGQPRSIRETRRSQRKGGRR